MKSQRPRIKSPQLAVCAGRGAGLNRCRTPRSFFLGMLSGQRATKVTLLVIQTRAPELSLRLLLHTPPGKQLHDVHYAVSCRLRRLAQRLLAGYNRWIYKSNSLGLGSCMQPLRAHKPNSIDSREGSRHHNDRDASSGHLPQLLGTRKQRCSSRLDSNTERCACVIHATFLCGGSHDGATLFHRCKSAKWGKCQAQKRVDTLQRQGC